MWRYDLLPQSISCFCTDGKISVRINLPLFSTVARRQNNFNTHKTCWKCCINKERPTGQKQQLLDWTAVENKGKLILPQCPISISNHWNEILKNCSIYFWTVGKHLLQIDSSLKHAVKIHTWKFQVLQS